MGKQCFLNDHLKRLHLENHIFKEEKVVVKENFQKRGRPPGSSWKDNPQPTMAHTPEATKSSQKRKRGRPLGSNRKDNPQPTSKSPPDNPSPQMRKRGRPLGSSRNKTPLEIKNIHHSLKIDTQTKDTGTWTNSIKNHATSKCCKETKKSRTPLVELKHINDNN